MRSSCQAVLLLAALCGACSPVRTTGPSPAPVPSPSGVERDHPPGIVDTDRTLFPDPVDRTAVRMEALRRQITLYFESHGAAPDRVDQSYPPGPEREWIVDYRHDAWGREYRYTPLRTDYELRSAGADGQFGTSDDIVVSRLKGTRWA